MNAYLYLGQYDKFLRSLPLRDSAYVFFYRGLGAYYMGHRDQALQYFDRAYLLDSSMLTARVGRALSDAEAGRRAAGIEFLRQTQDEMEKRGVGDAEQMYKVAQAYAVLGDKSSLLHMLRHTIEGGFFCYPCLVSDPLLSALHNEPELPDRRSSRKARTI